MLQDHPLAELFPLMPEEDFQKLKADIAECGRILIPIELYEGKILDGRHRYRACAELEIECPSVEYTGANPLSHILSLNDHRRHLDTSQRAMIAAKVATLKHGGDRRTDQDVNLRLENVSQEDAAQRLGVSTKSVSDAKVVLESGEIDLITEVEAGKLSVSQAATKVRQQKFIDRWGTEDEKNALQRGETNISRTYTAIVVRQRLEIWTRVSAGESQRAIADAMGMSQPRVSKLFQDAKDLYGGDEPEEEYEEEEDTTPVVEEPAATDQPSNKSIPQTPATTALVEYLPPGSEPSTMEDQPPPEDETAIYFDDRLEAYKRWLDIFAKSIALVGGLEDIGGMTAVAAHLSHHHRAKVLQDVTEISRYWQTWKADLEAMMQHDFITVNGAS